MAASGTSRHSNQPRIMETSFPTQEPSRAAAAARRVQIPPNPTEPVASHLSESKKEKLPDRDIVLIMGRVVLSEKGEMVRLDERMINLLKKAYPNHAPIIRMTGGRTKGEVELVGLKGSFFITFEAR